jgi:hypothetical protein
MGTAGSLGLPFSSGLGRPGINQQLPGNRECFLPRASYFLFFNIVAHYGTLRGDIAERNRIQEQKIE